MARNLKALRGGAVLLGVGALLAAAAAPGAVAATGDATAFVTRAVLVQANASNTEVERATLVTQVQLDGQGEVNFTVPVVEGGSPRNMDSFGAPTVENGQAVYNLTADGPETFRTSQDGNVDDIPVRLTVKAKLNGQSIDPTELRNVTGAVELQYTAENLTSTPTTLEFENGAGDIVEEDIDLVTSMGGTFDMIFPSTWTNISSKEATVITGDGSGDVKFSAGYTLMEPFGTPEQTITINAQVTDGSLPPVTVNFIVLEPQNNPTARAISASLKGGQQSGQTIYAGGAELDAGADQLIEGLTAAVEGSQQIADGVEFTLLAGVNRLWDSFSAGAQDKDANAAKQLVNTVRGEAAYQTLLSGFDELNSATALYKIQNILSKVIAQLGEPFAPPVNPSGGSTFEPGAQTATALISSLVFGAKAGNSYLNRPNPLGSVLGQLSPTTVQRGITNPGCQPATPDAQANPCGIVQLLDIVDQNAGLTPAQRSALKKAKDALVPTAAPVGLWTPKEGWPGGCLTQADGQGIAYADQYRCYYSPQQAAAGIVLGKTDLSTMLLALGLSLGKGPVTTSGPFNPTLQVDPSFTFNSASIIPGTNITATYKDTLKFGVCPGPNADEDAVSTHCSAAQVLSFLAAGVSGTPQSGFTQTTNPGPLVSQPADKSSEKTSWSDPVYGKVAPGCVVIPNSYPPFTIPGAPNSETQVKPYGAACAVRTLQSSLDDILLPTIAEGVRTETVASLGNGVYSPDCDPDTTPTLTCGISAIRAGIIDPLQPGTRTLSDGLPAALAGVGIVKNKAAATLLESGNAAAEDYGRQVALYDAMNNPDLVTKYIPGGAPEGDVSYNGAFVFELSGVGPQGARTGTNLALGALGLLAAAGVGAFAVSRRKAA